MLQYALSQLLNQNNIKLCICFLLPLVTPSSVRAFCDADVRRFTLNHSGSISLCMLNDSTKFADRTSIYSSLTTHLVTFTSTLHSQLQMIEQTVKLSVTKTKFRILFYV